MRLVNPNLSKVQINIGNPISNGNVKVENVLAWILFVTEVQNAWTEVTRKEHIAHFRFQPDWRKEIMLLPVDWKSDTRESGEPFVMTISDLKKEVLHAECSDFRTAMPSSIPKQPSILDQVKYARL